MKALSPAAVITLRSFAKAQAQYQRAVATEVGKLLQVQSVTQPNSRSTVALHDFASRTLRTANRWDRVGGDR
jgi:hypothetical protein